MQGVFFRAEARDRAVSLGLQGWVRNEADGSVEAAFEGEREHVERMLGWCRQGPRLAAVDELEIAWEAPVGEMGFSVR